MSTGIVVGTAFVDTLQFNTPPLYVSSHCCMHTPLLQLSDEYSAATNDAIIEKEKRITELEVVPYTYEWRMAFVYCA